MTNLHITRTEPGLDSPAVIVGVPEQGFGTAGFEQAGLGQTGAGTGLPDEFEHYEPLSGGDGIPRVYQVHVGPAMNTVANHVVQMAGFDKPQIPANGLVIDPSSRAIRRSDHPNRLTVYRRLQAHSQDIRHAPPVPQFRGRPGLFLLPLSGWFRTP